jgi:lipopolysaccharide biosynthesis protein
MISNLTRVAIYAHYSPEALILSHSWPYLESLIALGFKIIFVSNSNISIEDSQLLEGKNIGFIIRENIGLDFGMWKSALDTVKLEEIDELLLTNSSIMGPFSPLAPIFEKASHWRCDFWGITDNTELAPHLQSYFIVLRKSVLKSRAFIEFWNSVLPYHSKNQIIRSYEIGFTVWLEENGFNWRPLVAQCEVWEAYAFEQSFFRKITNRFFRRKIFFENITLSYPELLLKMGSPFLKSSLLVLGSRTTSAHKAALILKKTLSKSKSICCESSNKIQHIEIDKK